MTNITKKEKDYLPTGYTVPDKARQFMKLSIGDNNIRVLSKPLLGWVVFNNENKPIRKPFENVEGKNNFTKQELVEFKAKKEDGEIIPPKHFWVLLVWEEETQSPKVLEITQISIIKKLTSYIKDKDWGDLRDYPINITREGSTKNDTEYDVIAKPHKNYDTNIKKALKSIENNNLLELDAIYKGDYPFNTYNW